MNQSDEERLSGKRLLNSSSSEDLSVELGTLLRVLQDSRNLDRAAPVRVVEALAVDQLLQMPFFQLSCVVNDLVVVWNDGTFVGLLAHDKEVVIQANDSSIYESSWGYI